jgi:hypothetical protein
MDAAIGVRILTFRPNLFIPDWSHSCSRSAILFLLRDGPVEAYGALRRAGIKVLEDARIARAVAHECPDDDW